MARYIDADALIAEYDRVHVGSAGGARKLMVEAPTVDVVPKSEVDKTIAEFAHLHADALNKFENARAEGAREIISEFATLITEFVKDKGLYLVVFKNAIEYAETELKKKYTEGKE